MSYDINLVNSDEKEIYGDNYTYNVASMFRIIWKISKRLFTIT